jgi:Glycosyl hydrolase family 65, N-terminal domain
VLVSYERTLNMRTGILERDVTWEKGSGKRTRIRMSFRSGPIGHLNARGLGSEGLAAAQSVYRGLSVP